MCLQGFVRFASLAGILVIGAIALAPAAIAGPAAFQGLGDLPGGAYTSMAEDISGDGTVVVGWSQSEDAGPLLSEAFIWTQADGMIGLGHVPEGSFPSVAHGVSSDGLVVVGESYAPGNNAMRWTEAGGMVGLGDLPDMSFNESRAWDVSADGSVVVGRGSSPEAEAFRWTQAGGMVGLGDLDEGELGSQAFGVSADGSVLVGAGTSASGSEAFRWTQAGGMVGLGDLSGGGFGSAAIGISDDAQVIIGYGTSASGFEAFRWTDDDGMVGLGDLPGGIFHSWSLAANEDGSVVVGFSATSGTDPGLNNIEAFIWDDAHGMRKLRDVLVNIFDLDLTGWVLRSATAMSDDGLTIAGWGTNPLGNREAWIATIPTLGLPGDYNDDGTVNAADYTVYRNRKAGIGGTTLPNDAGAPGVTIDDYNYWKAHYGETLGSGSSLANENANVPEPASLTILLFAISGLLVRKAKWRQS
jgi:probable HAF family extracellular repeat protein